MQITKIETIPITVPILPHLVITGGGGTHAESPFLLVRVHTDAGITGLGEVSCTPIWSGEDQVTADHLIERYIAPHLIGNDPTEIERISAILATAIKGNPFTKAGLEMACWDILGKAAGLPIYKLLGGPVRDIVPTIFSVSGVDAERAAELARWAVDQGYPALKVKVGVDPDSDVARVRAVRTAVDKSVKVAVDANGGWSRQAAIQTIQRLQAFDIAYAEQPVPPADLTWLKDVRDHVPVPVMADESLFSVQDAMAIARTGAADILSLYVGKGGGIGPARKVAAIAEAAGLSCTIGSNLELGVASAAMIHLAVALPAFNPSLFPCGIIGPLHYESDILKTPLPIEPGLARAPEGPGLGVELDEERIEQYRVRK